MPTVLSARDYGIVFQRVDDGNRLDHVPPHVYTLGMVGNPMEGMELVLLKDRKTFNTPPKLYGTNHDYLNMVYDDWRETAGALGCMFYGKKGCGKTVLAEMIGNKVLASDVPVFLISTKIPTGMIKSALSACPTGAMVLFDEFEKVYDEDAQKELLALFSDSDLKKVLFIMTVNEDDELNEFLVNRPGRVKYWIHYKGIEDDVVVELLEEAKVPKVLHAGIRGWASQLGDEASFDILKFVCKEAVKCNDWGQLVKRIRVLNVPAMTHHNYNLTTATVRGKPYFREHVTFEMSGYRSFSIAIKCQEDGIDIYEEFDIDCDGHGVYDPTVKLAGDVILEVQETATTYYATKDYAVNRLSFKPQVTEVAQEPLGKNQQSPQSGTKESGAGSSTISLCRDPAVPSFITPRLELNNSGKTEMRFDSSFHELSKLTGDFDGDQGFSFLKDYLDAQLISRTSRRLSSRGSMMSIKHSKKGPKGGADM